MPRRTRKQKISAQRRRKQKTFKQQYSRPPAIREEAGDSRPPTREEFDKAILLTQSLPFAPRNAIYLLPIHKAALDSLREDHD